LEIRQKGEKFSILDPAQLPERPSSPNRQFLNLGGCAAGLGLGLLLALITEFFGISITAAEQISDSSGIAVLEVIPLIQTQVDRRRRHVLLIASSMVVVLAVLVSCAILAYHFRS
jgi:capsular polysaccharide biosynthesis protein